MNRQQVGVSSLHDTPIMLSLLQDGALKMSVDAESRHALSSCDAALSVITDRIFAKRIA